MSCVHNRVFRQCILTSHPRRLAVANLISVVTIMPILAAVLSFVSRIFEYLSLAAVVSHNIYRRSPMDSVDMISMYRSASPRYSISTYVLSFPDRARPTDLTCRFLRSSASR